MKTFNVEKFKEEMNKRLSGSTCSKDVREGMISSLEFVLKETKNYHGFTYLTSVEVPEGCLPGVREYINEVEGWDFKNTDSSRVRYF